MARAGGPLYHLMAQTGMQNLSLFLTLRLQITVPVWDTVTSLSIDLMYDIVSMMNLCKVLPSFDELSLRGVFFKT